MPAKKRKSPRVSPLSAATADRHRLYEGAVQCAEAEIDFVDRTFRRLRRRPAVRLREDFCGTAITACEWVNRRRNNIAVGVDLSTPTLKWATKNNLSQLSPSAKDRITLLKRNVLTPGRQGHSMDAVLAMNFSYWVFKTRDALREYFASVRASLNPDGILFLDHYGGFESMKVQQERRRLKGYTYIWDQASYNPITGDKVCHIHFEFPDGTRINKAFTYKWRLWTLPELRELLTEAGFRRVTAYWEGDDGVGGGNGVFKPRKVGEADASFINYIVAEK